MLTRTALVMLTFVLALGHISAVMSQPTPDTDGDRRILNGDVVSTERAVQITWDASADEIPGVAGWHPVSFRIIETEDEVAAFVEIRNVSNSFVYAPKLHVELFQDDFSYGTFEFLYGPEAPWTASGGSAFYKTISFFGNSLGVADWNRMAMGLTTNTIDHYDGLTSEGLIIENRRLKNQSGLDIPPVYIDIFVRDRDGIYSGSCQGPRTGARTPAGGSVRLSDEADPNYTPMCGFSVTGMEASEELGIGGPYTAEYHIVGFDQ